MVRGVNVQFFLYTSFYIIKLALILWVKNISTEKDLYQNLKSLENLSFLTMFYMIKFTI